MAKVLSRTFQPNIFMDFDNGKLFSNKIAESLSLFDLQSGEEPKSSPTGQYVYAYNGEKRMYEKTPYICPRCVIGLGVNESNNIKVDMADVVLFKPNGAYYYKTGEWWPSNNKEPLKEAGPLFMQGDVTPLEEVGYRPSLISMPQHGIISHGDVVFSQRDNANRIDGELFTVVVTPNVDFMREILDKQKESVIRRGGVMLCSDKRRLNPSSYVYSDGAVEYKPTDDYSSDDINYKFKVGQRFVEFIFVGVGSMIRLRSVVENVGQNDEVAYWVVENNHEFTEASDSISVHLDLECYYDADVNEIVKDFITYDYEGIIYSSIGIKDAISHLPSSYRWIDINYYISDDDTKDWRDRIIDMNTYSDYNIAI